ncbi:MAG TPA: hypothetical protein VFD36_12455 [Kofleriaceae bacterium]|nr:hypothetical protein [Kofleriaceae bacterium]
MMSGRPALSSDASLPRLLVLGGSPADASDASEPTGASDPTGASEPTDAFDVFEVLGVSGDIVQVRSALLFEVGEQLRLRIEHEGAVSDALAQVRGHVGPDDARITELEISERSEPRGRPTGTGPGGGA